MKKGIVKQRNKSEQVSVIPMPQGNNLLQKVPTLNNKSISNVTESVGIVGNNIENSIVAYGENNTINYYSGQSTKELLNLCFAIYENTNMLLSKCNELIMQNLERGVAV